MAHRFLALVSWTVVMTTVVMTAGASVVRARDPTSLDLISEVEQLLSAGDTQMAEDLLRGLDGDEYALASLWGLLELRRKNPAKAIPHFERALELRPNQGAMWLFVGQAHVEAGQPFKALAAIRKGKEAGEGVPSYYRLLAKSELAGGNAEAAYEALHRGIELLPQDRTLQLDRVVLHIELGLFYAAVELAREYLANHPSDVKGLVALAQSLLAANRPLEAAAVLEEALLTQPTNLDLVTKLGWVYASAGNHNAAARYFARAIGLGGDVNLEAAEQLRLAGRSRRALIVNAGVQDPIRRINQRLAILVDAKRWERAIAMSAEIERVGWTDETRCLLAEAYLQMGNLDKSEHLARRVVAPHLLSRSSILLQRIAVDRRQDASRAQRAREDGP